MLVCTGYVLLPYCLGYFFFCSMVMCILSIYWPKTIVFTLLGNALNGCLDYNRTKIRQKTTNKGEERQTIRKRSIRPVNKVFFRLSLQKQQLFYCYHMNRDIKYKKKRIRLFAQLLPFYCHVCTEFAKEPWLTTYSLHKIQQRQ